mgnify:FL=1
MRMSSTRARIGIMAIMVLLLGSLYLYIPSEEEKEVDAVGAAAITINLAQKKQTALVAPGQEGIVTFTGEVTAQIPWSPSIQYCIVYMQANAGGWVVSLPPPLIFSKQTRTNNFAMTVQVPPETSYFTQGQLEVTATWRYSPGRLTGTVPPTSAIIKVNQYYQFSVGCEKPYVEVAPGNSLGFRVSLFNEGNGNDKLRMEITNLKDLADEGWTVQLSQDKFQVPEKQERVLTVSVTTPVKWHPWMNKVTTINLKTVSSQAESLGQPSDISTYSMYVRQRGVAIPGFEPTFAIIALALIGAVGYNMQRKRKE